MQLPRPAQSPGSRGRAVLTLPALVALLHRTDVHQLAHLLRRTLVRARQDRAVGASLARVAHADSVVAHAVSGAAVDARFVLTIVIEVAFAVVAPAVVIAESVV